jgi:superkiller protein 3
MGQEDLNALRKLSDASDMSKLPVQSLRLMGNALIFAGDDTACVSWLRKAHRQHPGDSLISFDLAFHLSQLPSADLVEVLRFAEAGLAAQPSPLMYDFVGNVLNRLGRHDEAIAVYRRAIELDPKYVRAYISLGNTLKTQGKLDEAIACFRKAIELKPDFDSVHNFLGSALAAQGKLDEAIACYRKAIQLNPNFAWAYANLGSALAVQGKLDEAIAACRKSIEVNPKWSWAHVNLGNGLSQQGKLDEAVAAYREAIRLKPDDAGARDALARGLNSLAWTLATHPEPARRDPNGAVSMAKEAVELKPREGSYCNTLGTALYRVGRWKDAIETLERADRLQGGKRLGYCAFFIAMAHWQLGDHERARKCYDQAVEWMDRDEPKNEELRRFREEATGLMKVQDQPKPVPISK